ncbi:hypothetical protein KCU92_g256, partial [Aureobasidium melanogenum]
MAPEFVTLLAPSPRPDVLLLGRRPAGLRLTSATVTERLGCAARALIWECVCSSKQTAVVTEGDKRANHSTMSTWVLPLRPLREALLSSRLLKAHRYRTVEGIGNALDKLFAVVEGLQSLRLNSSRCQLCRSGCGHLCNSRQGHCRNLKTVDPDSRLLSTNNLRLYFIADNGMLEVELVSHCPQVTMDQATKSNFGLGILNTSGRSARCKASSNSSAGHVVAVGVVSLLFLRSLLFLNLRVRCTSFKVKPCAQRIYISHTYRTTPMGTGFWFLVDSLAEGSLLFATMRMRLTESSATSRAVSKEKKPSVLGLSFKPLSRHVGASRGGLQAEEKGRHHVRDLICVVDMLCEIDNALTQAILAFRWYHSGWVEWCQAVE